MGSFPLYLRLDGLFLLGFLWNVELGDLFLGLDLKLWKSVFVEATFELMLRGDSHLLFDVSDDLRPVLPACITFIRQLIAILLASIRFEIDGHGADLMGQHLRPV